MGKEPFLARFRTGLVLTASLAALVGGVLGVRGAIHSPLFIVRVVEIADLPEGAPVDAATLSALASVPVDQINLFDLDLAAIEKRVLSHSWVRQVHLHKRFPQTVSIGVSFREPKALIQLEGGTLAFVDNEGKVFGRASLSSNQADLPILSGLENQAASRIQEALGVLDSWVRSGLEDRAEHQPQLSTLVWDAERGYRALVSYAFARKNAPSQSFFARAMVDLGHDFDAEFESQLTRVRGVFRYLVENGIVARQIWADAGKKIVVKIARGS